VKKQTTALELQLATLGIEGEQGAGANAGNRAICRLQFRTRVASRAQAVGRPEFRANHCGSLRLGRHSDQVDLIDDLGDRRAIQDQIGCNESPWHKENTKYGVEEFHDKGMEMSLTCPRGGGFRPRSPVRRREPPRYAVS